MTLEQIAAALGGRISGIGSGVEVRRVTVDSRDVKPGDLFVAVRGNAADGHRWLDAAAAAGCTAVAVMDPPATAPGVPVVVFRDTRPVPALAARLLHGRPDTRLKIAGVTGTNGKTTTAFLLRDMIATLNGGCGLLGTIRYETGAASYPAPLTTPDGPRLYGLLADMCAAELAGCALEVSSHALDQDRTAGLELDVGLMTNLSRDHLDYHDGFDDYLAAKLRIRELLTGPDRTKAPGILAVNADDPAFADAGAPGLEVLRWSTGWRGAPAGTVDVRLLDVELDRAGTRLRLDVRGRAVGLDSALVGRFNVENLTAAVAAGLALGYDAADVCAALSEARQVPGRIEGFPLPSGGVALVDYAHTPDALDAVLKSSRELCSGRLTAVFGCGGDRDTGKRPEMGAVAARGADATWITSDNPRSEDPAAICDMIFAGYREAAGAGRDACRVEVDRTRAITGALQEAGDGDVVVIAGKGHEDYQIIGDRRLDLDDRSIVRDWIAGKVEPT